MKILVINESKNIEQELTDPFIKPENEEEVLVEENNRAGISPKFPAANVRETELNYFVELLVPGIDINQLEIEVDDDKILSVIAEGIDETEGVYLRREFVNGGFTRFFELPEDAIEDLISIDYKNGILTLMVPKVRPQ
jgi:HSP20 family protein